jgi:hypothetical protein
VKTPPRLLAALLGLLSIVLGTRETRSWAEAPKPPELGERVSLGEHGCSVPIPTGWERKSIPEGTMFLAPKATGLAANLIVTSEETHLALRPFADLVTAQSLKSLTDAKAEAKVVSDVSFAAGNGPAIKVTVKIKDEGLEMVQTKYFFEAKGRKITINATALAAENGVLVPVFDACAKALKLLAP